MAKPSFFELLSDPEEGPLLQAVLARPGAEPSRRAYHDFLRARGDARAELIGLTLALMGMPPTAQAPALRARLAELRADADPMWMLAVEPTAWLLGCGRARDQPPAIRFAFECDRRWTDLAATGDPGVRTCESCSEPVWAVASRAEAETHARAGHCISVAAALAGELTNDLARMVTGRPHIPSRWADRIWPD